MRIKITNPQHAWHLEYSDQEFEVCEGYNPEHPQYPVMTNCGRTWFNAEAVTVIEE
jgi:hypothetical protein